MTENQTFSSNATLLFAESLDLEQIQQELEQQHFARPVLDTQYVAPGTPTEKILADLWVSLLHVEPVGIDDDFFMLGGHSILATQALARVNTVFDIEMPISVFFSDENFTIRSFAQLIDQYQLEQVDEDELVALLDELDGLSEEEVQLLLGNSVELD